MSLKNLLRISIVNIHAVTLPGLTFSTKTTSISSYKSPYHGDLSSYRHESAERITPAAPYWGDFRREQCTLWGRKYSSIIHGVDWGYSWEAACKSTPAYIRNADGVMGTYYAARCDNQGFNMWGIFHVPESSCPGPGVVTIP
jgi:hypothetical protein